MANIDFALVEEKRPPMYTAMKYWGKKPHNIWETYIKTYASENETVLDPFSGSAVAAFEAVKCGRKAIAFDVNPLTSFIIDVYSTNFELTRFYEKVCQIVNEIEEDETYQKFYNVKCSRCGHSHAVLQHFKWNKSSIYEMGVVCPECKERYLLSPNDEQVELAEEMESLSNPYWYPTDIFYDSPSFTESFKKNIGGNSFDHLWTRRNLYVLAFIFNKILEENDIELKKQLLYGFIQSVHLSSKMCVPRREGSKRSFSTSWGRAAYICSSRQMEMNPLLLFKNNCLGKQSVQSALSSVKEHIGRIPNSKMINKNNCENNLENCDIMYGVVDIKELHTVIPEGSVSFIITDPPYGGLVQYVDLSYVWLVWLKHFDPIYTPNIEKEITIKKGIKDVDAYNRDFTKGIKNLYKVLKDDGKIVFTFHNKDLMVWNAFLRSISEAGFQVEKVIHQQNRRTGESNVANPYGTSASDFYIRCSKSQYVKKIHTTKEEFENFVIDRAVKIIAARNEPTPYQMLFNGLLSEISKSGFELENFDENIQQLLKKHIDDVFSITHSNERSGDLWWLKNRVASTENIIPLSQRVEKTISDMFEKNNEYTIDEIIGEIFVKYPNGLTPDIRNIDLQIQKYAQKSGNKWIKK